MRSEKKLQPVYFTQEDPIGLAGGMNLYGFAGGDPVNFSDPLGLAACTKEELQAGKETASNKGGDVCVERREGRTKEEAACSAQSFVLGAMFAADALAVGELYHGARATGAAWSLWRTNRALPLPVPSAIMAANRAGVAAAAGAATASHGAGTAAVGAPIAMAAERPATLGEIAKTIGTALIPFAGVPHQLKNTNNACNPNR